MESPTRGDNLYRCTFTTSNYSSSIELPSYYKFLNENTQIFISAVEHFGNAYGKVNAECTCIDFRSNCDGEYNVLIVGTRKDIDAKNGWTGVEVWK